jgi:dihydroorotase/N-acyl-D-amino-acid deacylase
VERCDELHLIGGGLIYDGSGEPPFVGDILISGERILEVGRSIDAPAATVLDARGKEVMPGFIDVHSHDDVALFAPASMNPKLGQGITTTIVGNCGHGCAPSSADGSLEAYSTPILGTFPDRRWPTFAAYLDDLASEPRRVNSCALLPHGPLRTSVLGSGRRLADAGERDRMAALVRDALDAGAAGVSLGLMYPPGDAADAAELHAIGAAVASGDGLLVAHVRNEADNRLESLAELSDIARRTGVAIHVSHLKVTGPRNFGRMPEVLDYLDSLRADGIDVTADLYPYEAGSTTVATLLPSWLMDGGIPSLLERLADPATKSRVIAELRSAWVGSAQENYFASIGPEAILVGGFRRPELQAAFDGCSITAIADELSMDPAECLVDLVLDERCALTVVLFQTDVEGIKAALEWPWTLIGSDGLPSDSGYVHPRLYGTFPRLLTEFAGEGRTISRAEVVKRATLDSARRFGIPGRDRIRSGAVADLQVIDPDRYADQSSFADPRRTPSGVEEVYVRGHAASRAPALHGRFGPAAGVGRTL